MNNDVLKEVSTEVAKCSGFDEKLYKWAELTVKYCQGLNMDKEMKIDRAFYAFQSKPKEDPKVLILGLNPRGMDNYESQYNNERWGLKSNQGMTPEVFIQQNQWYYGGKEYGTEKKEWNILKNLKKTSSAHSKLEDFFLEENIVYMNILYFNSEDFNEFKKCSGSHWKEIFDTCVELSKILILEILKPKKILCLGIDNCYKSFTAITNSKTLIPGALLKTKLSNIPVYGMTHPSARISDERRRLIGRYLYADWFNVPIEENKELTLMKISEIFQDIALSNGLNYKNKKLNDDRYAAFDFQSPNTDKSLKFEFQNSFFSDLRYELYQNKWMDEAKKCEQPYNDWINLFDNFDKASFKEYFEGIVKSYKDKLC